MRIVLCLICWFWYWSWGVWSKRRQTKTATGPVHTSNMSKQHVECCRSTCCRFWQHVERFFHHFDMSKQIEHVQFLSTCRTSNATSCLLLRHVACCRSTCCFDMLLVWTGLESLLFSYSVLIACERWSISCTGEEVLLSCMLPVGPGAIYGLRDPSPFPRCGGGPKIQKLGHLASSDPI